MLYDILMIDDDFSENPDLEDWGHSANKLRLDLLRENLRVTWTTGEKDDLERLSDKDLSAIRYILLDLHLEGISEDDNYRIINSKILGIFGQIDNTFNHKEMTCFINSRFAHDANYGYGDEGKQDLEDKLKNDNKIQTRYKIEVVQNKNSLSEPQKDELRKNNLNVYARSLMINKAIDVEAIFGDKLRLSSSAKKDVSFQAKSLVFQSQYLNKDKSHKDLKKQIQLLQEIRNKLAHSTMESLKKIEDKAMRKTFWKIQGEQEKTEEIKFDFQSLMKYLQSVDELGGKLRKLDRLEPECLNNSQSHLPSATGGHSTNG